MKYPLILALALSTSFLAACGGGGGDDTTPTVAAKYSLEAAQIKVVTTGVTWNGTAVDGANTYTMSLSTTPAADEVFEGVVSKKYSASLTIKANGTIVTAANYSGYYSINPFTVKGAHYADGTYAVATGATGAHPTAAKVGDSGSLGTLTLYTDANKTTVKSTSQSTWSMEPDTATTAFGCINFVNKDSAGTQTGTGAGCYKIDTSGNILGMRYTISASGKTLVFK